MQIDPKTLIVGLRPSVLKRVFRRREFSTYQFAKTAKLKAVEAGNTLEQLANLGWVTAKPHDWWETTEQGSRLAATPLIPPIPVMRARQLLDQVIAAAEAVNADPTHTYIVRRLVLFGSLLTAAVDGKVGDVDLVYELDQRELDKDKSQALRHAEVETAPPGHGGISIHFWPGDRVRKRLKVGRSVSLHENSDLELLGISGHQVYEFDRETGGKITLPW